jgi:hypothetical protein
MFQRPVFITDYQQHSSGVAVDAAKQGEHTYSIGADIGEGLHDFQRSSQTLHCLLVSAEFV